MIPTLDLTVAVPTAGRAGAMGRLLEDLLRLDPAPAEILVVDAMRITECRELCGRFATTHPGFPLRHVEAPPEDSGLPASRNLAARLCRTEFIAFLDDDTRVPPDYAARLLEPFASDPKIGGVGGYISNEIDWDAIPPEQRSSAPNQEPARQPYLDQAGRYCLDGQSRSLPLRFRWRLRLGLARLEMPGRWLVTGHAWPVSFWPPGDDWVDVDFVMGGTSAWRREVFSHFRFPSELQGYGHYEDLIFCLQARQAYRLVLHRGARLEHHHDPSARPSWYTYGFQVVHHSYSLWRQFTEGRTWRAGFEFWATETFNALARLRSRGGLTEVRGRLAGAWASLRRPLVFQTGPALLPDLSGCLAPPTERNLSGCLAPRADGGSSSAEARP